MQRLFTVFIVAGMIFGAVPSMAHDIDKKEIEAIIKEYIQNNPGEITSSLQKYYNKQRKNQEKSQFQNSLKDRIKISEGDAPVYGPKKASITIVEFSDFQCPFCARVTGTLDNIRKKYDGRLRMVFKHLPLAIHSKARAASMASMAANKQNKFWEYRDILMKNQNEWGAGDEGKLFVKYAKKLGLNIKAFNKDIKDKKFEKLIDEDMKLARSLKINGTPTFFVNGVRVSGARDMAYFDKVIALVLADKNGK